ncbi:MAG: alpha/beta fold hydrolase [Bacteroidota bacterium]|jgi:pimeloyl-ACP methyl ester carboxylesterase|nr:alpha/beta hydrolase [Ignavibacteria bacterium]MCU7500845.1 alpha/beta hydrolase [Ignavibacteria bacterium]MCU7520676.1 alpha/beta hydrolase [Ignavibacteria bacterium]MCU7525429.1 alpha/beta hydrolase [Ignavibacteria bacterium]HEX2962483.1 alpha/beta hydrolase [Ignavibacteriales bacterium]
MKNIFRKGLKAMLIIFAGILSVILVLLALVLIYSPGKPDQYLDQSGRPVPKSLSEKTFVEIGGLRQGMFIKSKNISNPVLLFLHGGPAFPNYFLIDKFRPGLEDCFTVCYWEQRGGGLSYSSDIPLKSMTLEQLTSDAIEVTNYLRRRFKKDKIFIMAHSGGTPIALMAAVKAPELYSAYIAMAQITRQKESEKLAYKFMVEQYSRSGNKKTLEELKKYPVLESDNYIAPFYKSLLRDETMHELGIGTMHNMKSVFFDIFIPVWTCRAYTLREKFNIWISKFSFLKKTGLIDQILATDFAAKIPKLEIPVYFFSGRYDLTVNIDLAKAYFKKLEAPAKAFYTFERSAHSPLYEEPERVKEILMKDVLNLRTNLSDNSKL